MRGGTPSYVDITSLSRRKGRGGTPSSAEDDHEDHSIDKDNKDVDYVSVTNQAVNNIMEGKDGGKLAAIIANHCNAFMERPFPLERSKHIQYPRVKVLQSNLAIPRKNLITSPTLFKIGKWV